jgi:hypothetical protein
MAKRRKTRELKGGEKIMREHDKRFENQLKNMDTYINNECIQRYGFISDSKTPPWKNKINALKSIDPEKLELRQPTNLAVHNLSDTKLPTGTQRLLGLSLKFCLEQNRPKPAIETTIHKMKRSIRIRYWLDQQPDTSNESEYIPGLYLPSEWTPPLATPQTEQRLLAFESELLKEIDKRKPFRRSNIDFFKTRALKILLDRTDLHISNSDKDLGPVVRNKRRYMAAMYKDHFHTNAYKRLTKEEASTMNQETRTLIIKTMHPGCGASKAIMTYHHRSLKKPKRDNQAYGLPKVHKDPIVDRPIISGVNGIT